MKDLKLGSVGHGGVEQTRTRLDNDGFTAARGRDVKGYDEVKTYIAGLKHNVTLRVKHGSGTGELSLGKESGVARLFKGDRSELTATTLAKTVEKRFGSAAREKFMQSLTDADGNVDLRRDKVLAAFGDVEKMLGLDKRIGAFEHRELPAKTGEAAVKTFVDYYPTRVVEGKGKERDGMLLSGAFFGDIVDRGTAIYENGVLKIKRGLTDRTPDQNFEALKTYFTEQLGIDPNDKTKMQNAMNNVLNFFEQNCYIGAAGEASDKLGFPAGGNEMEFEGTISFDGTNLQMVRSMQTEMKEIVIDGTKFYDRLTGWRYQAEDRFSLPLASTFVPNKEFKPETMFDASRVESVERGQRTVTIES